MAGEVKSQGTHLYFVDRTGAATLVKLACPTGITGLTGGAADQIESTCLDEETDKTFVRGLRSPVAVSVPFNLKPADASQQLLFELQESGQEMDWAALLSDGTDPPTLGASPDFDLMMPATRSGFQFRGYIAEVNIDAAGNDLIRGTLTVQRTGPALPSWKA